MRPPPDPARLGQGPQLAQRGAPQPGSHGHGGRRRHEPPCPARPTVAGHHDRARRDVLADEPEVPVTAARARCGRRAGASADRTSGERRRDREAPRLVQPVEGPEQAARHSRPCGRRSRRAPPTGAGPEPPPAHRAAAAHPPEPDRSTTGLATGSPACARPQPPPAHRAVAGPPTRAGRQSPPGRPPGHPPAPDRSHHRSTGRGGSTHPNWAAVTTGPPGGSHHRSTGRPRVHPPEPHCSHQGTGHRVTHLRRTAATTGPPHCSHHRVTHLRRTAATTGPPGAGRATGTRDHAGLGSLGRPSTISPMMLRCTWLVPA